MHRVFLLISMTVETACGEATTPHKGPGASAVFCNSLRSSLCCPERNIGVWRRLYEGKHQNNTHSRLQIGVLSLRHQRRIQKKHIESKRRKIIRNFLWRKRYIRGRHIKRETSSWLKSCVAVDDEGAAEFYSNVRSEMGTNWCLKFFLSLSLWSLNHSNFTFDCPWFNGDEENYQQERIY